MITDAPKSGKVTEISNRKRLLKARVLMFQTSAGETAKPFSQRIF